MEIHGNGDPSMPTQVKIHGRGDTSMRTHNTQSSTDVTSHFSMMPASICPREFCVLPRQKCPWTKIRPHSIILITFEDGFLSTGSFASVKRKSAVDKFLAKLKQNGKPFCFNFPIFVGKFGTARHQKWSWTKKFL